MAKRIKQGFQTELVELSVSELHPTKVVPLQSLRGRKYAQILSSVREVGIIEHPMVSPLEKGEGYLLLDGHLRVTALKELGIKRVLCLVSTEDETYTYNKYVNKLTAIQEHQMIVKAIESGVSEEKIASALNLELRTIRSKKYLLNGICPEVVEILKDKQVSDAVFRVLKKMKAPRQLKVTMLMNDQNKFTSAYAKALLDGTPVDQLVARGKPTQGNPAILARQARLEEESLALSQEISSLKEQYGTDMVDFTSVQSYLKRLLGNEDVAAYLHEYHEAIFEKFQEIVKLDLFKFKGIS